MPRFCAKKNRLADRYVYTQCKSQAAAAEFCRVTENAGARFRARTVYRLSTISTTQGDYVGFNTGNVERLIYSQAETGQASCLAVAWFLSISGVQSYIVTLYRVTLFIYTVRLARFWISEISADFGQPLYLGLRYDSCLISPWDIASHLVYKHNSLRRRLAPLCCDKVRAGSEVCSILRPRGRDMTFDNIQCWSKVYRNIPW